VLRPLALLVCALALVPAACGGGDDEAGGSDKPEAAPKAEAKASGGCRQVDQPEPKPDGGAKPPSNELDPDAAYEVVLETSCGDIGIRLDQRTSPKTAASFVALVKSGFFDGTVFHRIVPGFVVQGGDPTASGTGGPGYSTRDVPPRGTTYSKGTVAMAKTQAEPAGTAGSQFYIVTAPDAGLPPDYAVLGQVVEGQDVVSAIGELGDPASGDAGIPLQPVVIERATARQT
jgi:peptidyl-prolyl cis-trans isomerase B (cyclophilin B)